MGWAMTKLTDHISYADAQRLCTPARLWELFDGDRERLNIGHECIDRHPAAGIAVRIVRSPERGGGDEILTFGALAAESSRFAHYLADRGIERGERVGIMLEPSLPFYAGLFGAVKRGAIAVPLFTLFGPGGLRALNLVGDAGDSGGVDAVWSIAHKCFPAQLEEDAPVCATGHKTAPTVRVRTG